ncbi:MAG: GNAT family N-acetyltransferase [Pseudomonadota bacterium]
MIIRKAKAIDADAIQRIVAAAYAPLAERMDKPPMPMLDDYPARVSEGVADVLVDGDRVLGMIILVDQPDALMLENVAVAPEAQGRGVGRRLIDHAEAEARRRGHPRIRLYTHATMVENQRMYARLGYVETMRGEDEGYDRVQFEKTLK